MGTDGSPNHADPAPVMGRGEEAADRLRWEKDSATQDEDSLVLQSPAVRVRHGG